MTNLKMIAAVMVAATASVASAQTTAKVTTMNGIKPAVTDAATDKKGVSSSATNDAPDAPAPAPAPAAPKAADGAQGTDENFPASIKYKGITITPVAFFAAEGVWRQRSVNSDINTPFNSIPMPSATENHVSEMNFTGRQSRLGGLFEGATSNVKLTGYFEADFLGTGTSSNNNQSNSYVLRQRQIWGRATWSNGFSITGGQTWSLSTENRRGTDARTEIQPMTIDSQYTVGYSWERQPGFRIGFKKGDVKTGMFSFAFAAEQAQITSFTVASTAALPTQYFFGGVGQNGGLYNAAASNGGTSNITTYANNVAPDFLAKATFDVTKLHVELGGIARFMRNEYFPVTWGGTATAPTFTYATSSLVSNTAKAGGIFGSIRGYVPKGEVAVQMMAGPGLGRYGSAQLADATLNSDETLQPVKNYHGLFSYEAHINPKFDAFFYYGGEYAQRNVVTTPVGSLMGYGAQNLVDTGCYTPATAVGTGVGNGGSNGSISASGCASPTKYIQEFVGGFQYRPVMDAKYGKLQYSLTYSYLERHLWSGVGLPSVTSFRTPDQMIHVQMRYYIP